MKNRKKLNPFFRIFFFVSILVLIAVVAAIGLFYYVFGITEPEGLSLASWPQTFTNNFGIWMENENGNLKIKDIAIERLNEYGLWIQVVDEYGKEIFSYNKPENYPTSYSASELIALSTRTYEQDHTVFVSSFEDSGISWSYMIGFPYAIGKYMLYYNGDNIGRLFPVFRLGILFILCAIVILIFVYGFWLTRHLGKIISGIRNISLRTYTPFQEKGMFNEIYAALNQMDIEIRHSDKLQWDTERVRREWIANITHDLKTPLSPVKGYAELLADNPTLENETIQKYGEIILKNVDYVEKLMNDLKLTYQLESGTIPYNPQQVRFIRYIKELVIDIINDPAFGNRNIEFESTTEELEAYIDPDLFRRAIQNLIINALTHNPPDTKVVVIVKKDIQKRIALFIRDNGVGMSEEDQSELWSRYYRGTNTKEKPEGSGLGLAIAKQIVILHGGEITIKSKLNEGTEFTILLPLEL